MTYPDSKDLFRRVVADTDYVEIGDQNNMADTVEGIEDALGLNPEGGFATVVLRLDDIETDTALIAGKVNKSGDSMTGNLSFDTDHGIAVGGAPQTEILNLKTASNCNMRLDSTNNSAILFHRSTAQKWSLNNKVTDEFWINYGGTKVMVFTAAGNVVVGSTGSEATEKFNVVTTNAYIRIKSTNSDDGGLIIQGRSGDIYHIRQDWNTTDSNNNLEIYNATGAVVLLTIRSNGNFGFGASQPTAQVHINGSNGYDQLRLEQTYTPTGSADANGNIGDIAHDADYIYVKTSGGWKRSALSTF